jgi:hypothetical protein
MYLSMQVCFACRQRSYTQTMESPGLMRRLQPAHRVVRFARKTRCVRLISGSGSCTVIMTQQSAGAVEDGQTSLDLDVGRATQHVPETVASALRERVDGSRHNQAEERERHGRLHKHRVFGAVGQWHHVRGAERGRIREAEV